MPNYTEHLLLEQPLDDEQYDVGITRRNNQKIDDFSQTMPKLYSTSGDNSDGAMTQEASTNYIKEIISAIYPVGSIYIGTQATCPLETLGIGTWTLVAADRVLQGSSGTHSPNTNISAALPSLTAAGAGSHNHGGNTLQASGSIARIVINEDKNFTVSGVFEDTDIYNVSQSEGWGFEGDGDCKTANLKLRTSGKWSGVTTTVSNHTHTVSWSGHVGSTVQPNAYVVNIWRRTA